MVEDPRLEQGRALHRAGHVDEALALYDAVLAGDPAAYEAMHLKALAVFQRGKPADALALLDRAIEGRPDTASYHLNRGVMLAAGGRNEAALADFALASRLAPDNADILYATANAQTALGRLVEARDML
ncbi:MAG: tetratricopeptide repeat protein, partial [Alphaproteobacteria bacterium]|nr:tetratricopeptide repeat protein [Alphaproteobacteria bacterium]